LELQPDFKEQKSLVQVIIAATGHLCIFLPKFHCELNFIEFFWGMVKRYLREHCDYTFDTLKENLLKALASVPIATIRWWEHRMYRWMDAYRVWRPKTRLEVWFKAVQVSQTCSRGCSRPQGVNQRFPTSGVFGHDSDHELKVAAF
jgi:hypothetical protein